MDTGNTTHDKKTVVKEIDIDFLVVPTEAEIVPELSPAQAEALLGSIREKGIEQPLRVYQSGTAYAVLSGRHRFGCARLLNFKAVPCVIVEKPHDVRLSMVEEAVLSRDMPRAGRAAMIVDAIPSLLGRKWKPGNPSGRNGQRLAIPPEEGTDEAKICKISERYGVHRDYLAAAVAVRLECKDEGEWKALKAKLFENPIGPTHFLSALRGIQSGGANADGKAGRAGTDVDGLAMRTPATIATIFKRWGSISDEAQSSFMTRFRDALKVLPTDGHVVIRESVQAWPEHECKELQKAVESRLKAIERAKKA